MSIFDYFRKSPIKNSASVAKERLQIIIAHERTERSVHADYFQKLQKELIEVIGKYVDIDDDQVKVALERNGDTSVLELNITLPEAQKATEAV